MAKPDRIKPLPSSPRGSVADVEFERFTERFQILHSQLSDAKFKRGSAANCVSNHTV